MSDVVPIVRCPCCGADRRTPVLGDGTGALDLARCDDCGLVHALGHHPHALLDAGYDQRSNAQDGVDRQRKQLALRRFDELAPGRVLHPRAGARALDLGCNTGMLLDALAVHGWITEGVERSPGPASVAARRHRIHDLDLEDDAADIGTRYELVTMTHVLEHMLDPVAVARFVARHLGEHGIGVIEVPNWDDAARRLWGRSYRPLELGDHVSFFDRDALTTTVARGGLNALRISSRPHGASLVMPSLLSAIDVVRSLLSLRSPSSRRASSASTGKRERVGGGLRGRVLLGLDRLDPVLDVLAGDDPRWGANLVAIVTAR